MKLNQHIFIGVGTNLGDRLQNIRRAYELIEEQAGQILQRSSVYQSPPWGFEADQDFYNTVICLQTEHTPDALIRILKNTEQLMGRVKTSEQGYESRVIDLDIVDFEGRVLITDLLQLPHPNMHRRAFVLKPLQEICPRWVHPVTHESIDVLLNALNPSETAVKLVDTNV